jgi:hypothetical protein
MQFNHKECQIMSSKKPAAAAKKAVTKAPAKAPAKAAAAPATKPEATKPAGKPVVTQRSSTLYVEIANATKVAQTKDEALGTYAIRVTEALSKLTDEDFNKLSAPAQAWFNAAVEKINATPEGQVPADIPELPGFTVHVGTAPAAGTAVVDSAKDDAAKAAAAKAKADDKAAKAKAKEEAKAAKDAEKAAAKAAKEAAKAEGKVASSNKESISYKMRRQVVLDPAISFEKAKENTGIDEPRGGNAFNAWQNAKHVMAIHLEEQELAGKK